MMAYVLGYSACLGYCAYCYPLTEKVLAPEDDGSAVPVALMMQNCWEQSGIGWTQIVGL
jgi:hypothetical protein